MSSVRRAVPETTASHLKPHVNLSLKRLSQGSKEKSHE